MPGLQTKEDVVQYCQVCGKTPTDRAHVKSKGSGGTWEKDNIVRLCRPHHIQQHFVGWPKFLDLYPHLLEQLQQLGWELVQENGRRRLIRALHKS